MSNKERHAEILADLESMLDWYDIPTLEALELAVKTGTLSECDDILARAMLKEVRSIMRTGQEG